MISGILNFFGRLLGGGKDEEKQEERQRESSRRRSPELEASLVSASREKAQPPGAASAGAKASLQSKTSSASSSFLTPPSAAASFASPFPAKSQSHHASFAGAKTSPLSKPCSSSQVSSNSFSFLDHNLPSFPGEKLSESPQFDQRNKIGQLPRYEIPEHLQKEINPFSFLDHNLPSFPGEKLSESPQFDQRNKIDQLPRYEIPEHLQKEIRNDVVPQALQRPLSPSTYADYFAALLYAEDYYLEKWSNFLLHDVTLELREKDNVRIQDSVGAKKSQKSTAHMDKPFVAFEIDSVPEKRPYLLSRDHVRVRPAGKQIEPFQGILFRVEKSKWVLAEFEDDFHEQHSPLKKYDVSFSFNRVCLKRAHQAVSAAMDPFLCSILFPDPRHNPFLGPIRNSDFTQNDQKSDELTIIMRILGLKSPQPYLLEGSLSQGPKGDHYDVSNLVQIAILKLYKTCSDNRILVCAPRNRTLDALTISLLKKGIPESKIFRTNAAFRDFDEVPDDIMPACLFEGERFTCPPLAELRSFRVVTSTFISSYRLYAAGIGADHFTHIFLVDASSSTEPETIVAFANLVAETTAIVVTGSAGDRPLWVRSDIGRKKGLQKSFFQRLLEMEPYSLHDPMYIAHI